MRKILRSLVIVVCFICAIIFFNTNVSEANKNTELEITSQKTDLFIVVRVYEQNRFWIYFYTDGGIYITKMEEL